MIIEQAVDAEDNLSDIADIAESVTTEQITNSQPDSNHPDGTLLRTCS